ncbi:MAG: sugar phosphate isomerase/epimerase family protein [Armatimonadota bacterium]
MKMGLCTIALREKLLEDVLNIAKDTGFEGVEIWGREPHISETFDEGRVLAARHMVKSRDLAISMFGSYLRFGAPPPPNGQRNVTSEDALLTTQALGTRLCRVWAGDRGSAEASRAYWDRVVEEMSHACDLASNLDIELAIEMHDNTLADTGESTVRLIEEVGAPNLKANYQASFRAGHDGPYERLEAVLPYVVNVHAQNYSHIAANPSRKLRMVSLERGVVEYERIVGMLAVNGYDGYICVEFVPPGARSKERALSRDRDFLLRIAQGHR